jgi:hypothetical protein
MCLKEQLPCLLLKVCYLLADESVPVDESVVGVWWNDCESRRVTFHSQAPNHVNSSCGEAREKWNLTHQSHLAAHEATCLSDAARRCHGTSRKEAYQNGRSCVVDA